MTYRKSNDKEMIMQRYVDLLKNSGFKAVFGDRNNKEVVKSVINVLLPTYRQVTEIEFAPTEHQGPTLISKEFQYDFLCRSDDGTSFIVEVQRYKDDCWFKRCVSYACREKECHDLQEETIVLIFAELGRFNKIEEECTTDLDKMCYLLKNMGSFDSQPAWLQQEVYTRIFDACEISGYDEEKLEQLQKDMYDERKRNSELKTAKRIGFEEGLAEGEARIIKETIKKMAASHMTTEQICSILNVEAEFVKQVLK